jgi:reactive intermediate/imine deaminase
MPPRPFPVVLLAAVLLGGCSLQTADQGSAPDGTSPTVEAADVEYFPRPVGEYPFAEAVRVGNMLFLSGQIGTDPVTDELVPGGIEAETRRTMDNIRAALERHGSSMDRVVKCTVMMADMAEWPAMNAIYRTYFSGKFPARSAFGATGLALGARVEIECAATIG